jgi:hypothetical protein
MPALPSALHPYASVVLEYAYAVQVVHSGLVGMLVGGQGVLVPALPSILHLPRRPTALLLLALRVLVLRVPVGRRWLMGLQGWGLGLCALALLVLMVLTWGRGMGGLAQAVLLLWGCVLPTSTCLSTSAVPAVLRPLPAAPVGLQPPVLFLAVLLALARVIVRQVSARGMGVPLLLSALGLSVIALALRLVPARLVVLQVSAQGAVVPPLSSVLCPLRVSPPRWAYR